VGKRLDAGTVLAQSGAGGGVDDATIETGATKVADRNISGLANFGVGSLLFGQFLSDRPFSLTLAAFSLLVWVVLLGVSFILAAEEAA
jgi:hypothetical protein